MDHTKPAQWFRMYAEFATDPKVQMLSEADQRRYIMLLCLRCSNGDVTLHDEAIAFQLRISESDWASTKAALIAKNLILDDNQPTAWDKRQKASDSSAARVAKHRALHKTASNGDVTLQQRTVEKEKEVEKEKNNSTAYAVLVGSDAADAGANSGDNGNRLPNCPHQRIIDLYAEHLPEQPQPRSWEGQRAKHLQARWRWLLTAKKRNGQRYASTEDEALDFFRRMFQHIRTSDFLMKQFTSWDLGWIVKAENFEKIIAGNYENREAA